MTCVTTIVYASTGTLLRHRVGNMCGVRGDKMEALVVLCHYLLF